VNIFRSDYAQSLCTVIALTSPGTNTSGISVPSMWAVQSITTATDGGCLGSTLSPPGGLSPVSESGVVVFDAGPGGQSIAVDITLDYSDSGIPSPLTIRAPNIYMQLCQ
jgi:hypothetical protein